MLRLSGTKLHRTTAYHPQSDGQTEVRNRGLEQYLRSFTADRPSKWSNFLLWAELALNCFHHTGLGTSPFRALYGREPPPLIASLPSQTTPPVVADLIRARGTLLVELRRNLERAQQRMRDTANAHRRDVEFKVGDLVLLKLQPYRQHSVARPQSAKLARRFYGPFPIIKRIGQVAYRLELPPHCRIHNVFHVSLLRPFVEGASSPSHTSLPDEFVRSRPVESPVSLLERRSVIHNGEVTEQGLVQWSDGDSQEQSWEPMEVISRRYPSIILGDKDEAIRGGVDTVQPTDTEVQTRPEEIEGPTAAPEPVTERRKSQRVKRPTTRYEGFTR